MKIYIEFLRINNISTYKIYFTTVGITILTGHVLVSPKRVVARFKDLKVEEVADLWYAINFLSSVCFLQCLFNSFSPFSLVNSNNITSVKIHNMPLVVYFKKAIGFSFIVLNVVILLTRNHCLSSIQWKPSI